MINDSYVKPCEIEASLPLVCGVDVALQDVVGGVLLHAGHAAVSDTVTAAAADERLI